MSVLAAYFLSMLHLARGAEPTADPPSHHRMQSDGLSADERRELTRQMLKERRENPEEPAEVKPMPSLRPTAPETADRAPIGAPASRRASSGRPPAIAPPPQIAAPQVVPEPKPRSEPEGKPRPEAARPAVAAVTPAATPLPRAAGPRVMRAEPAPRRRGATAARDGDGSLAACSGRPARRRRAPIRSRP